GPDRGGTASRRGDDRRPHRPRARRADAPDASGDEGVRVRHPSNAPPFAPDPGRALRTLLPGTPVAGATARPDPRHQRVDGALLARAAPVRVCRDGRGQTRRGLLLRDATYARHPNAPREGP